ncbi:MAG: YHS domain-containing (seleno)protein [SAR324 cluster bacterium]|nr:YHS domain-containing (seleno)protein [SAR324 cluster bacterium]
MTGSEAKHGVGRILAGVAICSALALAAGTAAAVEPVNTTFFSGLALEGYDPVAYFFEGEAVEGDEDFEHSWQGATWRFSSEANLQRFMASPARFAPQFGGYCAYGVSVGVAVDIDPDAWKIVDDKLYLNLSKRSMKLWEQNVQLNIRKGRVNWPRLLNQG